MEEKNRHYNDEIDFLNIFRHFKLAIARFFQRIGRLIQFSLDNAAKLSIFILVGAGIGFGLFHIIKHTYISDLALMSKRLNNDQCVMLIQTLDELADDDKNAPVLAKKLGISEQMAKEIKSIEYKYFSEKFEKVFKDSIGPNLPFKVRAKVYNPAVFDSVQAGIVNYLETNEYALKLKKIDIESMLMLKSKIRTQISQIDSLKLIINQSIVSRNTGNGIVIRESMDPVMVYQKVIDLYKNELEISRGEALIDTIDVINGFTGFIKPSWPKLWLNILLGIVGGYIIGLFWLSRNRQ